jgi:phosphoribosylanthranilate isomerase
MVGIKICGINDLGAMQAALDAGADYVGLVFFPPSPRAISLPDAAKLASLARGRAKVVALTVDGEDALFESIAKEVNPDIFQLHGRESIERLTALKQRYGKPLMKALPIASEKDLEAVERYAAVSDWILFDAQPPKDATRPGGHGKSFDWNLLATMKRPRPVMLSGGLEPENVAAAISTVQPDAVDVSSGVESAPGMKDVAKIKLFVANTRAAAHKLEKAS